MAIEALPHEVEAAQAYETLHVPSLFSRWAGHVAGAAAIATGERVLDVACGTGVLARHAAGVVGGEGSVTGLDIGAGMLAVAQQLGPEISWHQGSAESLPFGDAAFDVVLSQFGLMFFPDRVAALREMHRVLAPGGRLVVAVWDELAASQAYPELVDLLHRLAGQPAADALRAPYVLGDAEQLTALFQQAGVADISLRTMREQARFPSLRAMVEADLRGWLPVMGVQLEETLIEQILQAAESALSAFVAADGSMRFETSAHIVCATRL